MFVFAGLLVVFSLRWQLVEAGRFSQFADQRYRDDVIPALRGTIYAADGSTLVYSERVFNVYVYMPELEFFESRGLQTRTEFTDKLAPLLDSTGEKLREVIDKYASQGTRWIKVGSEISVEKTEQMDELKRDKDGGKLIGQFLEPTSKRIYPEGRLASQVLGLVTVRDKGKTVGSGGIEGAWDGSLEPLEGFIFGERDALGNAIATASEKTIEAKRGSSIYTTIDKQIQNAVQENLKWAVETYEAESGSVVVMDPKTGEVMAMANYPDYDPNLRETKNPEAYGNPAVAEPYEIGSVGKIFTLATAIDAGVVEPSSVILESGHLGCEKIHDDLEPVCTHDKLPQPPMAISEAFALSDNIYFLHLAQMINKEVFYNYMRNFGIGSRTGVDLDGESSAPLKDWESWNVADVSAYSYGHSYQMNLLQAASGVAAVANYGVRMEPHFATKLVDSDGKERVFVPTAVEQVLDPSTTYLMDEMMYQIYKNNIFYWEHHYDDLRDYKIAMKSGTALIPRTDGLGYTNDINATYVGYDASPDRKFILIVRLERPVGALASQNARVLWLETFRDIKDYLGVKKIGEF